MSDRPNILLFLMDGVQASALDPASACQTPNFDRLRERGLLFRRAYTSTPVCSPARASLLTGQLPHNHGVLEVEHGRDPDQCNLRTDHAHWPQRLQENGYTNAYFGKWHVERSNRLEDFGWQINRCKAAEHHQFLGQGKDGGADLTIDPDLCRYIEGPPGYNRVLHYGVTDTSPEKRYPAFSTDQAIEFLDSRNGDDSPWTACISFSEPNESLVVSRSTFEQYDVDNIPLPENLNDDLSDRPNIYQRQQQISEGVTDDEWRLARTCYYGRITELDTQFGRLLKQLEDGNQLDNTIIIVTADHGRYVGAHGFDAHNFGPFEEIYRIPLIMAGPGIANGQETQGLVNLHDLCPTLLELSGSQATPTLDSKSLVPLLFAPAEIPTGFNTAYGEYHGTRFNLAQRILWQGEWKFVFNGFDFDELYNLATDPHESTNLATLAEHRDRCESMMREIWRIIRETGDRTLNETHYYSMRMACVGPNAADPS